MLKRSLGRTDISVTSSSSVISDFSSRGCFDDIKTCGFATSDPKMLKKLMNEVWHTDEELVTDQNGYVEFRGFYGEYEAEKW